MTLRHTLAHLSYCTLLLAGCAQSFGSDDDLGPPPAPDLGRDQSAFVLDEGLRMDAGVDGGRRPPDRGPLGASCEAEDAAGLFCPDIVCDGLPTWHWNGHDCIEIECGTCVGADCDLGRSDQDSCLAEHAACESTQCRETGGTWRYWAEDCGHFACGFPPPQNCLIPVAVCDCGNDRRFVEGRGCQRDPGCEEEPPDIDREQTCRDTGGTWGPTCCDSRCGEPCLEACTQPACTCGPDEVFDSRRGCIESEQCLARRIGEPCGGRVRCIDQSAICCANAPGSVETCQPASCAGGPCAPPGP